MVHHHIKIIKDFIKENNIFNSADTAKLNQDIVNYCKHV